MASIPSSIGPAGFVAVKKPRLSYRRSLISAIGAAVLLCTLWSMLGSLIVPTAMRHDFLVTYTAARMARNGEYAHLHDPAVMLRRLRETDPETLAPPIVRPHFYAFLLQPLAALPLITAFWVWLGIQASLLIVCWIWAVREFGPDALIWGALSVPCCLGIFHGQDCIFLLAIGIGGFVLAKGRSNFAAGAVWGLALVKFHLVLFFAPAMLLARRWKMFLGFSWTGATLFLWSLMLGGSEGIHNHWLLLRNKDMERLNPTPDSMISIQGILANLNADFEPLRFGLGLLALAVAAMVIRRQPLWRWLTLTITASLFAAPHVYGYDAALMVLPIWLVQQNSRLTFTRAAFAAFATPLPFLIGLADRPWTLVTPLCLAACFGAVTWEAWMSRHRRTLIHEDLIADVAAPAL
jgi:hypothetical protein